MRRCEDERPVERSKMGRKVFLGLVDPESQAGVCQEEHSRLIGSLELLKDE
jgi:hypothetical protein